LNTKVVGFGCGPWRWYKGVGKIHMNKGRVGEERRGKETDGCPLTLPPLQKHGVTMREDYQEVARSALVKRVELKMAADNLYTTQTPECTKEKYNVKIKMKGSLLRSHQQPM
jgi:hypothetical protein